MALIVDAHAHWFPPDYFEGLVGRRGYPRAAREGDGYRYHYDDAHSSVYGLEWLDVDLQLEAMAATGHEVVAINSGGTRSGLDDLAAAAARDAARAFNEGLADAQRKHPGRFFGAAAVPLQDVGHAIEELEHAIGRLDLRAVSLPGSVCGAPLDASHLEPFFARVAQLGVPAILHPTDSVFGEQLTAFDNALQYTVGRLMDSTVAVVRLVLSGVIERHPELKLMHCHGGGAIPYIAGRIDKNGSSTGLAAPPSEYLRRMWVDTVVPDGERALELAIGFYGPDRVLFGSDYPCWSPQAALDVVAGMDLDEATRAKVMGDNARALFDLRTPAADGAASAPRAAA